MARTEPPMEFLAVIEDDPDLQLLIETIFSMDSRFSAANATETAEEALTSAQKTEPGIIVLDHGLAGPLTGLDAAPLLKELAPRAAIAVRRIVIGHSFELPAIILLSRTQRNMRSG